MSRSKYRPKFSLKRLPRWYRNEWTTRALRREAKCALHRAPSDCEPMLTPVRKIGSWSYW